MAKVQPFCATTYNLHQVGDLSHVVTPPFDVISAQDQALFYQRHAFNIIRIILGEEKPTDSAGDNRYLRAARFFEQWRAARILLDDPKPAFYLGAVDFLHGPDRLTRFGITGAVGLEPFERRIILPHEHTFSNVKNERLQLIKACPANFSPIFALFSHGSDLLAPIKQMTGRLTPDFDFIDPAGLHRRVWRIDDPLVCADLTAAMADKTLLIADGHHRYETALNYRNWRVQNDPGIGPDHRCHSVMMTLCQMEDPGLVILPAHRLVKRLADKSLESLLTLAGDFFEIDPVAVLSDQNMDAFLARLHDCLPRTAFGLCIRSRPGFFLMVLKDGVMDRLFGRELATALRLIDVTVLTHLIFIKILGFSQKQLDDESFIEYTSHAAEAIQRVAQGHCDAAFLINATRIQQVRQVAEAGLVMPRKATYFSPKVLEGELINALQ